MICRFEHFIGSIGALFPAIAKEILGQTWGSIGAREMISFAIALHAVHTAHTLV